MTGPLSFSSMRKLLVVIATVFGGITILYFYRSTGYPSVQAVVTADESPNSVVINNILSVKEVNSPSDDTQNIEMPENSRSNLLVMNKSSVIASEQLQNNILKPLDDFLSFPCVPGIPPFPTSSWSFTGKCVRLFNDTKGASQLSNECVSLKTSKGTTPICIYNTVEDHFISASIKNSGQWEGGLVKNILEMLEKHPGAEFLDLGCNIGTYSLAAAAFGRHVTAVDAVIDNLALLSKSLTLGKLREKAILIWNAISDDYSQVTLTKFKGNVGGTAIRNLTKEDAKQKDTFITQTIRLDDLVPLLKGKTVVIKMDIETKEYSALLGGTNFFEDVNVVMIQMEINWHRTRDSGPKIVDYLAARNLSAFADPRKQKRLNVADIKTWPGDVYFLKP